MNTHDEDGRACAYFRYNIRIHATIYQFAELCLDGPSPPSPTVAKTGRVGFHRCQRMGYHYHRRHHHPLEVPGHKHAFVGGNLRRLDDDCRLQHISGIACECACDCACVRI